MSTTASLPQPLFEKLRALLANDKLPNGDRAKLKSVIERYHKWLATLKGTTGEGSTLVKKMVALLEEYKRCVEIEFIFDSPDDFLYRQKGQLKLDNSIIEEFLPHLVVRCLAKALPKDLELGARNCFSAVYFMADIANP